MEKKLSEELKHCLDGGGCDKCDCYETKSVLTCRNLLQAAYERIKEYENLEDGKNGDISRYVFPETAKKCIEYMQAYINSEKPRKLEREGKLMLHNVTITKSENKVLEEYWLMRGVKTATDDCLNSTKKVIAERECNHYPELSEIARFLSDSNADFVSVEHNYRFEPDLPFC